MIEAENEIVAVDDSTAAIVPNQNEQFDLVDIDGAKAYMNNYQEAIKAMLTPEDYQTIAKKDFKKKSAWRKLATAFRISDKIVDEELEFDDTNQILRARYRVRCTLPNGRSAEGVGVCSIFDKIRYNPTQKYDADTETPSNFELRGRFSNAEHDVPSTAHSRAKNRAISDLIGAGEVSAEEMGTAHAGSNSHKPSAPKPAKPTTAKQNTSNLGNKPKAPKPTKPKENEAIEVEAKAVEDLSEKKSSRNFKELCDSNAAITKAVKELQANERTVNRNSVMDKLMDLWDLGTVSDDEYKEAKALLE